MKTCHPFHSTALVLAALAALAAVVAAQPAGVDVDRETMIAAALAELPENLRTDVQDLMTEMNMTSDDTHFQRFIARENGAVVNQSMALIK